MGHDRNSRMPLENAGIDFTRRGLLQRAAWLTAAAAFPCAAKLAAEDVSPVMSALSNYMSEARNRELPDKVLQETKHHILDTIAAMVSGSDLPPGRLAIQFARAYGCGPIEAAVANGVLAHSDESDDDYTGGGAHPGAAVVPAALALGEQFGSSGMHYVRAVALGYDIGMRSFKALGPKMVLRDTHNLVATFGAAAAGGCLASLNPQQMRWLMDYAGQQAGAGIGAWRRDTEHIEKSFVFAGMSARNGVMAAMLVQSGWTGVADILSGPENFMQSYSPQADPAGWIDKLGERYDVTQTTIKRWTTGGPIQSPLDAMQLILKKHPFEAKDVKQVVVRAATSAAFTVNNRETASFKAAHDKPRMQDPEVLRQRAKVQLIGDEELEKLIPKRVAIVEITLNDGTILTERVESVRGTPENPMNREEIVAKARDLMDPVLGAAQTKSLIEKVLVLENMKSIRELRPLLQKA